MGIGNGLNRGGTMGVECGTLAVRRGAGTLSRRAGLALGAIAIGVSFLGGTARADDELPVSAITLYRSGVGFFQRQGLVEGDAEVQLRFDADQINDILKSMVVLDLGGGEVGAARYASKEPLERRLSSFAIDVSDNPSIAELMKRLRGAPVKLQTIDGGIEGTIMGVEGRPVVINDQRVEHAFVSLITSKGVRSIDVANVSSFEITDEQLAGELTKALAAMAEHRADNVKAVDLSFHGTGSRRVAVGYVHEMPVWKTSYRLVLPEGTSESGGQPTLQGWAIVENTTDEDWEDVRLSLVAGRPVGFTMDLYEPLFAARPEMPVPFMAGVRPKVYEGGGGQSPFTDQGEAADARYELRFRSLGPDASREREANKMQAGRAVLDYPSDWPSPTADDMTRYAARAQAAAGETGEVFQYTLSQPVSVGRQQSAMLPILSTPIDGRRVSIYNRSDLAEHPMRGVEVTNSSDLKLMAGPVSVFDGAAYAGDAQVGNVSTGEKRLIAYAVDLDVASTTKDDSTSTIQTIRIVRGMFELTNKSVNSVSYAFENADAKRGRTIIVEHPKLEGWELVGGAKPAETASGLYRFEVELPAKGKGQFGVRQERVDRQRIGIMDSYDWSTLVQFQRDGKLSQTVLDAVRKAYDMKRAVDEVQRRVDALQGERSTIMNDQGRIRQNMGGIDRTSDLYRRYVEKLSGQENRLEEIEREVEKAKAELDQKRNEFDRYVAGLNVE